MKRVQKIAWAVVIVFLVSLFASLVTVAVAYTKVGMPKALYGFCVMGFTGLAGLAPIVFRNEKGRIVIDERDNAIKQYATLTGFTAAFLFAGAACMIPFFILGPKALISVSWLPQIWIGIFLAQYLFYSMAILIGYGRETKGKK